PRSVGRAGWGGARLHRAHGAQGARARGPPPIQGSNLSDVFHSLARTPYVAAEVMYDLQDSGQEQFGLLRSSGARKPAFAALSRALASPFASTRRVNVRLRRSGRRVLASGSGPVGDYMQL